MLVSYSKKFIYVKTVKTAGTSVEMALQKFCAPPGINIHEATPEVVSDFGIVGARGKDISDQTWRNHMGAKIIKEKLPDGMWDEFTKICNIRNPWDSYVSYFHFIFPKIKKEEPRIIFNKFQDWALENSGQWGLPNYFINGKPAMDVYIRYENLDDDLRYLCAKLDLPNVDLIKTKHLQRGKKIPYQHYYNDAVRSRVAELRSAEIEFFGWKFD